MSSRVIEFNDMQRAEVDRLAAQYRQRVEPPTMPLSVYRDLMDGLDEFEGAFKREATETRLWVLGHRVEA